MKVTLWQSGRLQCFMKELASQFCQFFFMSLQGQYINNFSWNRISITIKNTIKSIVGSFLWKWTCDMYSISYLPFDVHCSDIRGTIPSASQLHTIANPQPSHEGPLVLKIQSDNCNTTAGIWEGKFSFWAGYVQVVNLLLEEHYRLLSFENESLSSCY